ncbi:hypothetical protein IX293_002022 [Fusobacterium necrophorum]|nr:hypothetical protein [Fusobacterium necrophorum]MBR8823748.1 hypothetical protein [Fusobacterium necrophorum]
MDKESEVTADGYRAERKAKNDIVVAELRYINKLESISVKYSGRTTLTRKEIAEIKELERQARLEKDKEIDLIQKSIESVGEYEEYAKTRLAPQWKLVNSSNYVPEKDALKARYYFLRRNIDTTKEYKEGTNKAYIDGLKEGTVEGAREGAKFKLAETVLKGGSRLGATVGAFFLWSTPAGGGELLPNEIKTKRDPRKIISTDTYVYLVSNFPEYIKAKENEYTVVGKYENGIIPQKNQAQKMNKGILKEIKNFYEGTPTLDEKLYKSDGKIHGNILGAELGYKGTGIPLDSAKGIINSSRKIGDVTKELGQQSRKATDYSNSLNMSNKAELENLSLKKDSIVNKIAPDELIKFKDELSAAGAKLDEVTGVVMGPKGGKGYIVGKAPDNTIVVNMSGKNVKFANGKQNSVPTSSFRKFEIPKTAEVVEAPSGLIAKNNYTKPSENGFSGFLDKTKSKVTGKPIAQVQLERIGIKSEVKDLGLKVDGITKTGLAIDEALENNLGRIFKTYDNYDDVTKTATSVKSIDMTSKTYTSGSGLNSKLNSDLKVIKDFTEYELKTVKLENKDIENRILRIVINNEPLNKSQMKNLKKVVGHATEDGIKVEAVILK